MQKSWLKDYEIETKTGGGNADVYFVKEKLTNRRYALKQLRANKRKNKESSKRFVDELNIMKNNSEVGIMPIIRSSKKNYWYTMPIAEPIFKYVANKKVDEIIFGIIQLAETLESLHDKGISHRDIKPANIYYYNSRFVLGDFGLVNFPNNNNNLTRSDRGLGAIFTIAPEMKRNPKKADGKKADVFSLAKTMWMLLTRDEKGFDGIYNYMDQTHRLQNVDDLKEIYLVEIDELLKDATDNNPNRRPTIKEFKERLLKWQAVYSDSEKSQASNWDFLSKQLFGEQPPNSSAWSNPSKITEVLNTVGQARVYNHMLLPNSGGVDFSHAEMAAEENCIKLYDTNGYCYLMRPKHLYFEGFDENFRWNYFLLELEHLKNKCENSRLGEEYLVEDTPGHYVTGRYAQYGVYDYESGEPLPDGYQTVYRYTKGKFLIVMKNGPYNRISGTYDGRHGDISVNKFREYIDQSIDIYQSIYEEAKKDKELKKISDKELEGRILGHKIFNKNPFQNETDRTHSELENLEKAKKRHQSKEYIKENYKHLDFKTCLKSSHMESCSAIKFAFNFSVPEICSSSIGTIKDEEYYLLRDGHIRKKENSSDERRLYLYDREEAILLKDNLDKTIALFLKKNNLVKLEEYEKCFSIEAIKNGNPKHLFTKQEIEKVMREADDRFDNQLVIDENGYAKVIQNDSFGSLFPVRHERWIAGNIYVGKYSSLETLDDDYLYSLQGWLQYLRTGQIQFIDYMSQNDSIKEILEEIDKYYI